MYQDNTPLFTETEKSISDNKIKLYNLLYIKYQFSVYLPFIPCCQKMTFITILSHSLRHCCLNNPARQRSYAVAYPNQGKSQTGASSPTGSGRRFPHKKPQQIGSYSVQDSCFLSIAENTQMTIYVWIGLIYL